MAGGIMKKTIKIECNNKFCCATDLDKRFKTDRMSISEVMIEPNFKGMSAILIVENKQQALDVIADNVRDYIKNNFK